MNALTKTRTMTLFHTCAVVFVLCEIVGFMAGYSDPTLFGSTGTDAVTSGLIGMKYFLVPASLLIFGICVRFSFFSKKQWRDAFK